MNEVEMEELVEAVRELVVWTKLAYGGQIANRFEQILDDERKLAVYEATDGTATTREIGRLVGVDQKTVSTWWRAWANAGIVQPGPIREDRPMKLVSLTYLGLL